MLVGDSGGAPASGARVSGRRRLQLVSHGYLRQRAKRTSLHQLQRAGRQRPLYTGRTDRAAWRECGGRRAGHHRRPTALALGQHLVPDAVAAVRQQADTGGQAALEYKFILLPFYLL